MRVGVRDLDAEFERLRPNLAHHFAFELDRFQKEAVVHLEQVGKPALDKESRLSVGAFRRGLGCPTFHRMLRAQGQGGTSGALGCRHVSRSDERLLVLLHMMHHWHTPRPCRVTWPCHGRS